VRLEVTLSRPDADWTGRRGYVQTHVRELWAELVTHGESEAYVCGVLKMLNDVRAVLKGELGLDRHHIHAESYG
jgi:NAD(P)H-flavin reductase